jgi:hypothetical protein
VKTYKELADAWGVTKDAVRYRAGKLPAECRVIEPGITYITDVGIAQLRESFGVKDYGKSTELPAEITHSLVDILRHELDMKNRQIVDLTTALSASQALHAGTIQHIADSKVSVRPGWLSRIFGLTKSKNMSGGASEE